MTFAASVHTILEGWLPDQAALKGVLDTLYDLRLSLEEVTCLEPSGVCRSEDLTLFHDPENNL